ncbi:MAG: hypothetical protein ACK41D_04070 [Rubricoccaceae bacterium]
MSPIRPRRAAALVWAVLALAAAGCDNPLTYQTDHLEAVEVVVRDAAGAELARTVENRRWEGPAAEHGLTVAAGTWLELQVTFLTLEGREVQLGVDRRDLSLRVAWDPEGLAVHEPLGARDRLLGLRPGQTALRLLAWHGTHPDFVSPPLRLTITD